MTKAAYPTEPAATPNPAVATPRAKYSSIGGKEPQAGGAEGLEAYGVVDAVAVSGGERPAQDEHGHQQGQRARSADGKDEIGDQVAHRIEHVAHPHGRDGGELVGRRLEQRRLFLRSGLRGGAAAGKGEGGDIGVRCAAEGVGGEHHDEVDAEALPIERADWRWLR
jgi:hypothetical protein